MEMQFFVKPGDDEQWFEYWKQQRMDWLKSLGLNVDKLRFHVHGPGELAHYAKAAFDIEYEFPFGWKEFEGIHNRTNFDLTRHQEHSGKKLDYLDPVTKEKFVPFVVETSIGADRLALVILIDAYTEDQVEGETRVVLKLNPSIAPIKAGIFPLVNKDGMPEAATRIHEDLRRRIPLFYDDKGAIGRRYRRQDEAGTPFGVTIDGQTLQDQTVTVRDRDTLQQERVSADQLGRYLTERLHR
jgi:glycyl-tRNA synthetase